MRRDAAPVARDMDRANQRAMASAAAALFYEHETHLDPSEKLLYDLIAPEAKGKPVLDIGVGGGRTIPALTAISHDYTAVDYSRTMTERLAQRYPKLRLLHADARDLSILSDGSFFLVVFSCAGIDMVGHVDRGKILREVRRVLAPGGAFIFSTHNWDFRKRVPDPDAWSVAMSSRSGGGLMTTLRQGLRALRRAPLRFRNYHALKHLTERHESWGILNSKYHDYSTLMHYITLDAELGELKTAGFGGEILVYEGEGRPMKADDVAQDDLMHVLARA
jgi:SAM-dependent methyltransferase